MERQVFLQRIKKINDEIRYLGYTVESLQNSEMMYTDNYKELSHKAALEGEHIVKKLRGFACDDLIFPMSPISSSEEYLIKAADALDISIREDNGMIEIILPCLIPKRKGRLMMRMGKPS